MSRKGNCYDNDPMESFWGTLKTELIYPHGRYTTRREAELAIREYIEVFYNRQRIQRRLDYLSPTMFEQKFLAEQINNQRFGFHYWRPTSGWGHSKIDIHMYRLKK